MTLPQASSADADTLATVSQLVTDLLVKQGRAATPPAPADALTDAGVSSLDMVNLMLALEARFDIFIPPELITPASFRSIQSIAVMIDGLRTDAVDPAA